MFKVLAKARQLSVDTLKLWSELRRFFVPFYVNATCCFSSGRAHYPVHIFPMYHECMDKTQKDKKKNKIREKYYQNPSAELL